MLEAFLKLFVQRKSICLCWGLVRVFGGYLLMPSCTILTSYSLSCCVYL